MLLWRLASTTTEGLRGVTLTLARYICSTIGIDPYLVLISTLGRSDHTELVELTLDEIGLCMERNALQIAMYKHTHTHTSTVASIRNIGTVINCRGSVNPL